jgi:hypothetical protein
MMRMMLLWCLALLSLFMFHHSNDSVIFYQQSIQMPIKLSIETLVYEV